MYNTNIMSWESIISGISGLIGFVLGGGILWFTALKYKKAEVKGQADQALGIGKQESEKAEELELGNVEKVITIYKSAIADIQHQYEDQKIILLDTINQLKDQLELERTYIRKITEIHEQRIKELEIEIANLKRNLEVTCNDCDYISTCLKYKNLCSLTKSKKSKKSS